jgi:peptide deformylase
MEMADLNKILLLGDPRLYLPSVSVQPEELSDLEPVIRELGQLVHAFRNKYGKGRAIAAPQIGVLKRIIVLNIDQPVPMINPVLHFPDQDMMELWDDCMSFPNLLVRVKRFRRCILHFTDVHWNDHEWQLENDLSELIQHEYDHLDGILATQRAIDNQSFKFITFESDFGNPMTRGYSQ